MTGLLQVQVNDLQCGSSFFYAQSRIKRGETAVTEAFRSAPEKNRIDREMKAAAAPSKIRLAEERISCGASPDIIRSVHWIS